MRGEEEERTRESRGGRGALDLWRKRSRDERRRKRGTGSVEEEQRRKRSRDERRRGQEEWISPAGCPGGGSPP
jgi:hypothetical protein